MNKKIRKKVLLLCIPGFAGFILFYLFPFLKSFQYSMINNTLSQKFVFLDNYISVIGNKYYQLALKNTFIFSLVGVLSIMLFSVLVSFLLWKISSKLSFVKNLFMLPMILPTASIIAFWKMCFDTDSYFALMKDSPINGFFQVLPIFLLYIWKNSGINIIIIMAGLANIPPEIMEAASLDGAHGLKLHRKITLPLTVPYIFFVFVLSFVNSLKIFKESYLFFGTNYPPDSAYTVQYYMNNHFQKLNYQNLTAGVIIFTLIITVFIFIAYRLNNRLVKDVY